MIVYSIQDLKAIDFLNKNGVLYKDKKKIICFEDFYCSYEWMSNQLRKRVGKAYKKNTFPIWVWKEKPDLRSRYLKGDEQNSFYRLSIEIPEKRVLFSNFDLWHHVLGGYPVLTSDYKITEKWLDRNDKIVREFVDMHMNNKSITKRYKKLFKKYYNRIGKSWELIFDLLGDDLIQGCMWYIKKEEIIKMERYDR